jgi:hypothetical protein
MPPPRKRLRRDAKAVCWCRSCEGDSTVSLRIIEAHRKRDRACPPPPPVDAWPLFDHGTPAPSVVARPITVHFPPEQDDEPQDQAPVNLHLPGDGMDIEPPREEVEPVDNNMVFTFSRILVTHTRIGVIV